MTRRRVTPALFVVFIPAPPPQIQGKRVWAATVVGIQAGVAADMDPDPRVEAKRSLHWVRRP